MWLTQRAFTVSATASGNAGLAAARAKAPDVIIAELMVPDGGVSLVRALREEAGCRDTIIIVLTTQAGTARRSTRSKRVPTSISSSRAACSASAR